MPPFHLRTLDPLDPPNVAPRHATPRHTMPYHTIAYHLVPSQSIPHIGSDIFYMPPGLPSLNGRAQTVRKARLGGMRAERDDIFYLPRALPPLGGEGRRRAPEARSAAEDQQEIIFVRCMTYHSPHPTVPSPHTHTPHRAPRIPHHATRHLTPPYLMPFGFRIVSSSHAPLRRAVISSTALASCLLSLPRRATLHDRVLPRALTGDWSEIPRGVAL
jgi:hypothetical protein